jgi:hypothetical protein
MPFWFFLYSLLDYFSENNLFPLFPFCVIFFLVCQGAILVCTICDHEVMGSSPETTSFINAGKGGVRPKVVGPFPISYASGSYVHRAAL